MKQDFTSLKTLEPIIVIPPLIMLIFLIPLIL